MAELTGLPTGFFQLQSPLDLLRKMEADYSNRLIKNPLNAYAAFDFFVAAAHLPDWLFPKTKKTMRFQGDDFGSALNAICEGVANTGKHFNKSRKEVAVLGTTLLLTAVGGSANTERHSVRPSAKLLICLSKAPARTLRLNEASISAVELAEIVLSYWREHSAIKHARELDPTWAERHHAAANFLQSHTS